MAHTLRITFYTLALFLGLSSFASRDSRHRPLDGLVGTARVRLMAVASSYVGVCETGRNDGPLIRMFQATTGNKAPAEWCSSFAATCYVQARVPLPAHVNGAAKSFFAPETRIYENGKLRNPAVEPLGGDMVGYVYTGSPVVHHVGFEKGPWGRTANVYTLEGNVTNCVRVLMRPKRSIAVVSRHLPI